MIQFGFMYVSHVRELLHKKTSRSSRVELEYNKTNRIESEQRL